jgi:hypothetical protein
MINMSGTLWVPNIASYTKAGETTGTRFMGLDPTNPIVQNSPLCTSITAPTHNVLHNGQIVISNGSYTFRLKTDGTWENLNAGNGYALCSFNSKLYGCVSSNTVQEMTDLGSSSTWAVYTVVIPSGTITTLMSANTYLYCGNSTGYVWRYEAGVWVQQGSTRVTTDQIMSMQQLSDGKIYVGTDTGYVFRLDGTTWTALGRPNAAWTSYIYHVREFNAKPTVPAGQNVYQWNGSAWVMLGGASPFADQGYVEPASYGYAAGTPTCWDVGVQNGVLYCFLITTAGGAYYNNIEMLVEYDPIAGAWKSSKRWAMPWVDNRGQVGSAFGYIDKVGQNQIMALIPDHDVVLWVQDYLAEQWSAATTPNGSYGGAPWTVPASTPYGLPCMNATILKYGASSYIVFDVALNQFSFITGYERGCFITHNNRLVLTMTSAVAGVHTFGVVGYQHAGGRS